MTQRLSLFRPETMALLGCLALTAGVVKMFAPRQGTISIFPIEKGQRAHAEQPPLTIAIDQTTADGENVDAAVLEALAHYYVRHDLGFYEQQDDILMTPMTYNSPIGDMDPLLSGWQKQGLLLPRVLYRRLKILFLDEETADLDVDRERQVNQSLRRLAITRVSVARRPETIRAADKVFMMGNCCSKRSYQVLRRSRARHHYSMQKDGRMETHFVASTAGPTRGCQPFQPALRPAAYFDVAMIPLKVFIELAAHRMCGCPGKFGPDGTGIINAGHPPIRSRAHDSLAGFTSRQR